MQCLRAARRSLAFKWTRALPVPTTRWTSPAAIATSHKSPTLASFHNSAPKWEKSAGLLRIDIPANSHVGPFESLSRREQVVRTFQKARSVFARDATEEDVLPNEQSASSNREEIEDVLERWKRFVSVSGKEMTDVEASDVAAADVWDFDASLPNDMKRHVTPDLSWQRLRAFARAAALAKECGVADMEFVVEVRDLLDDVCARKLREEDRTLLLDRGLRGVMLELAFLRFNKEYPYVEWRGKFSYLGELTSALLSERIVNKLRKDEVIFLVLLAGLGQARYGTSFLGQRHRGSLPDWLRDRLADVVANLSLGEAGIVADGLYKSKVEFPGRDDPISRSVLGTLMKAPAGEILDETYSVASVAKFLQQRVHPEHHLMERFAAKFEPLLSHLHPSDQIQLARLMMRGDVKDCNSFVNRFASSIKPHLGSLALMDLEHACLVLQHLNYDLDMEIYAAVEEALLGCEETDPISGMRFVSVVTSLSRAGHFSLGSIERIMQIANRNCAQVTEDATSLIDAGYELCSSVLQRYDDSASDSEGKQKRREVARRSAFRSVLENVAELDCCVEIEVPEYSGERLDPELRHRIQSVTRTEPLRSAATRTRLEVLTDLRNLLGEENVFYGKAVPHAPYSAIVFCLSQEEPRIVASPLPADFIAKLEAGREVARPPQGNNNNQWFVFIVPSTGGLNYYNQPIGILATQLRQLQALGYVTVIQRKHAYQKAKRENNDMNAFMTGMIRERKWPGKTKTRRNTS